MRQVVSIQNRVHSSGVPAWFVAILTLEADDDDFTITRSLLETFLKE
jgi:hypothetical protein